MTWELFRCGAQNGAGDDGSDPLTTYQISSALIRGQAQAMSVRGFTDAGFILLSVDDCWVSGRGEENNTFIATPSLWPNASLKSTADYVHALGMQLGTCAFSRAAG